MKIGKPYQSIFECSMVILTSKILSIKIYYTSILDPLLSKIF